MSGGGQNQMKYAWGQIKTYTSNTWRLEHCVQGRPGPDRPLNWLLGIQHNPPVMSARSRMNLRRPSMSNQQCSESDWSWPQYFAKIKINCQTTNNSEIMCVANFVIFSWPWINYRNYILKTSKKSLVKCSWKSGGMEMRKRIFEMCWLCDMRVGKVWWVQETDTLTIEKLWCFVFLQTLSTFDQFFHYNNQQHINSQCTKTCKFNISNKISRFLWKWPDLPNFMDSVHQKIRIAGKWKTKF